MKEIKTLFIMTWKNKEFERFGVVEIEGDKVKVYKAPNDFITIPVNNQVAATSWVDGELLITLSNGSVRYYMEHNSYIIKRK